MEDKKQGYYESLYEIAATVNSVREVDSILNTLAESVTKAFEAKGCSLMLFSPDGKELRHTGSFGLSNVYVQKGPVVAGKRFSDILDGKPVVIMDALTDERIEYRDEARREGIASIISVPMKLKGEVVGVVNVYTTEMRHFTQEDVHFLEAVAHLGAIALLNANLFQAVQKSNEELRHELLEWRTAMGVWPPRLAYRR